MKLTLWIIGYWWHQITLPMNIFLLPNTPASMWEEGEGLLEHGGMHYMTFWYLLNHEWYLMNNKKFARTDCTLEYIKPGDDLLDAQD